METGKVLQMDTDEDYLLLLLIYLDNKKVKATSMEPGQYFARKERETAVKRAPSVLG